MAASNTDSNTDGAQPEDARIGRCMREIARQREELTQWRIATVAATKGCTEADGVILAHALCCLREYEDGMRVLETTPRLKDHAGYLQLRNGWANVNRALLRDLICVVDIRRASQETGKFLKDLQWKASGFELAKEIVLVEIETASQPQTQPQ